MSDNTEDQPPYERMSLVDVVARAICAADEAGRETSGTDEVSAIAAEAVLAVPVTERMRMVGMASVPADEAGHVLRREGIACDSQGRPLWWEATNGA